MKHFLFLVILFSALIGCQQASAQITVLNYNSTTSTKYKNESVLGKDSIYIIYTPNSNGIPINDATLTASFNNIDSLNYTWYFYDAASSQFNQVQFDDTANASLFKNAVEGGYKVRIENSKKNIDTSFVAWLFIEKFDISEIRILSSTCENLTLLADTTFEKKFIYYDLVDYTPLELVNKFEEVKWTLNPINEEENYSKLNQKFPPPVEPTTYKLEITDAFGFITSGRLVVDELLLEKGKYPYLRAVKANFKGISSQEDQPRDTSVKVEAPFGVLYKNDSKNGINYEWLFYNHEFWMNDEKTDSLIAYADTFEPFDSIYYIHPIPPTEINQIAPPPGYDVKLFTYGPVFNDDGDQCLDTIRKKDFVLVDSTEFPKDMKYLPNVFNPENGTGKNKYFYFLDENLPMSVKYFSIKIYNRWGNKIYEFEDTDGSWIDNGHEGWDGQTKYWGKAKPGVYYYVMLATGWDERNFEVEGYIHIFY